jgi:hypothetical protein
MVETRKIMGGLGNRLFQFAYIYAQHQKGIIPDVYVQDFEYFKDYKEEIRKLYQDGIGKRKEFVALHIRRGDYVDNPFYVDLTKTDYYDKALAEFPNEKFLVFYRDRQGTNDYQDREWINQWLTQKGIKYEIWEGQSEVDDLNAMASCKSIIAANSSFSVWAAFISPFSEKNIFPTVDKWYTDGKERTVLPTDEGWIRL